MFITYLVMDRYDPKKLGYSSGGYAKFIKKVFPDKPATASVNNWLLLKYDLKYCACCGVVRHIDNFNRSYTRKDGLNSQCKDCSYKSTKKNSKYFSSKRRAAIKHAMPTWIDLSAIKAIYTNCPVGFVVDHIVPLQGKNVCGLHVPWNLQYLTIQDNRVKYNKHESDYNFLC